MKLFELLNQISWWFGVFVIFGAIMFLIYEKYKK